MPTLATAPDPEVNMFGFVLIAAAGSVTMLGHCLGQCDVTVNSDRENKDCLRPGTEEVKVSRRKLSAMDGQVGAASTANQSGTRVNSAISYAETYN